MCSMRVGDPRYACSFRVWRLSRSDPRSGSFGAERASVVSGLSVRTASGNALALPTMLSPGTTMAQDSANMMCRIVESHR